MAVKLKKAQLSSEWKNNAGKYIAQTVQYPVVETEDLAQQVALNTGFTKTMVQNILENCLEAAGTFLSIGHPVRLGKIGTVRVNVSTVPADTPEDIKPELKAGFRCSNELKNLVKNIPHTFVSAPSEQVTDTGDDEVNTPTTPSNGNSQQSGGQQSGGGDDGMSNDF